MQSQIDNGTQAVMGTGSKSENTELLKRKPIVIMHRCPQCASSNTYVTGKGQLGHCRKCGKIFALTKKGTKKGAK